MTEPEPLRYPFEPSPSIYHPAPIYAELQRTRPVAKVTMSDGTPAWLVTRYADVRRVLTEPLFSRARASGSDAPRAELGALEMESLIGMDPPEHTRLRQPLRVPGLGSAVRPADRQRRHHLARASGPGRAGRVFGAHRHGSTRTGNI